MADLKLFPSEPPTRVVAVLRDVLRLPQPTLVKANSWLRSHSDLLLEWNLDEALSAAKETSLTRADLSRIFNVIFNFGMLVKNDDDLTVALSDIKTLGLDDGAVENFKVLMGGLRFPEGQLQRQVSLITNSAVPIVLDTRVVCDLRGVFEEEAGPDASEHGVAKLMALSPVAILSLDIEDESGDESSVVVQFSETDFKRFVRTILLAQKQLGEISKLGANTSPRTKGG
jgi:hypothetical protein